MTAYSYDLEATRIILHLAINEQENENDSCFLICGKEGTGKSNLLLNAFKIIEEYKGVKYEAKRITRTLREFLTELKFSKSKDLISLDEGGELSSKKHNNRLVIATEEMFKKMRKKSFITFICFTNPARINTYFREDRIKGVFLIPKKREAIFFTSSEFQRTLEYVRKYKGNVKSIYNLIANASDYAFKEENIPKYEGHLKEEYDKRKDEDIDEAFDEIYNEFVNETKTYSISKVAKELHIARSEVSKHLKTSPLDDNPEHIIKCEWNPKKTKAFIDESEVLKFKEYIYDKYREINKIKNTAHDSYKEAKTESIEKNEGVETDESKPNNN